MLLFLPFGHTPPEFGTISYTSDSRIPTKTVSVVKVNKGKSSLAREIAPQSVPSP